MTHRSKSGIVEIAEVKSGSGNSVINKKKNNILFITILVVVVLGIIGGVWYFQSKNNSSSKEIETQNNIKKSPYRLSGNGLESFDLYFLKLNNEQENKIYSPLSIKYAMQMLAEGATGETKQQLDNVLGDYKTKKYINSKNMSFANALFIRDTYKNKIKSDYIKNLSNKYNAEVIYDSFANAKNLNNWVSDKTFSLVKDIINDEGLKNKNYLITNALAIDMEWNKVIQDVESEYFVSYSHENGGVYIDPLFLGYNELDFNNKSYKAQATLIGASINKYDIVKTLGEEKIRSIVGAEYEKWLGTENGKSFSSELPDLYPADVNKYLDKYISEINSNYKEVSSSTDFSLYDDQNVKAFAKDLKTYDGTTLQYVGIMPKVETLADYIKDVDITKLNNVISNLKDIKLENFEEGYITEITGYIPTFKIDYSLDLINNMKTLGITNVFDANKSNLSNFSSGKGAFIEDASHKANIEFSNEGIKASAVTFFGGFGDAVDGFDYIFDAPIKKIDLTFDKPYLFLVRDKNSGEVWFTGTVYTPTEYTPPIVG